MYELIFSITLLSHRNVVFLMAYAVISSFNNYVDLYNLYKLSIYIRSVGKTWRTHFKESSGTRLCISDI